MNALKSLLVIPLLALFLVSFNTETIYQFKNVEGANLQDSEKKLELLINKDTSDEELMKMKNDLAKEGVDLSYTTVRNDSKEIIDISLEVTGGGENGASFKNSHSSSDNTDGISPLVIIIDLENSLASIMTKGDYKTNRRKIKSSSNKIWISSEDDKHKEVIIEEVDGVKKIFVDGKEVDEDELQEYDIDVIADEEEGENVRVHIVEENGKNVWKHSKKGNTNIMILKDGSGDNSELEVIGDDGSFFFVTSDGGKEPLYYINGKSASKKEVKKLSPSQIESMDVYKGKKAVAKYGKKAKNGVVEIITKE